MRSIIFLLVLLLVALFFFGCGDATSPYDDIPTDLEINQFQDNKIELSWFYYNSSSDTLVFHIARKVGDSGWNESYRVVAQSVFSIIDQIPTNDTLVYGYKVRYYNITQDFFSNYSEAVAFFSDKTIPSDIIAEQISQQEIRLTWEDNSLGEEGFKIDRKVGAGDWVQNHKILGENTSSFLDEVSLFDTLYYRVFAYFGISKSGSLQDSIFNSLAAPSDLHCSILDENKIRLEWIDNSMGEEGFYIDRKLGSLDWQNEYAAVDSSITTYIDDITLPCATLQYRVRAFQNENTSNQSNAFSINIHLQQIGALITPGFARDVFIPEWTAFVADSYQGLAIIDCSNPSQPQNMLTYNDLADRTLSIFILDNIAYIATQSGVNSPGQIHKVDLMDIMNPFLISSVDTQGIPKDIFINGDFAYVAEGNNGLSIMYVASSILSSESNYPLDDARKVFILNQNNILYAFVANGLNGLEIVNVMNATNPAYVSHLSTTGLCNDVHILNDLAFLADGEDGLMIVNVSDATNPIILAQLQTGGFAYGVYAENNYVYLIDKETGLYVIDVSNPLSPFILGYLQMDTEPVSIHLSGSYVYITDNEGLKIVQVKP